MINTAVGLRELMDELPLLEEEYLAYEYTLPYTQAVIDALADGAPQLVPGSRILAVWPDDLTRHALVHHGYTVDVWASSASQGHEDGWPVVSAEGLLDGSSLPESTDYDAILLNCVVERLEGPITLAIRVAAERLVPGGLLLVTTRQAGRLSLRLRALLGRQYTPNPYLMTGSDLPRGWNAGVARRYCYAGEICEAALTAGLSMVGVRYVEGFAVWNGTQQAILPLYLARAVLRAARHVLTRTREFAFISLRQVSQEEEMAQGRCRKLPALPAEPFVSIVVPTFNRSQVLRDLLETLFKQSYAHDRYEIIVVDNSSSDDTAAMVAAFQAGSPVPLEYYCKENEGPAISRNAGIARARGDVIGFTDSDCLVDEFWIESAIARFTENIAMVAGRIEPRDSIHRPVGFFSHTIAPHPEESPLYPTANVFYRNDVLAAEGGFDPQFRAYSWGTPVGGEDTDLAWRVREAGYCHQFAPDVLVGHQATPVTRKKWLLDGRRAAVAPVIVRLHPQLRREWLLGGVFLSPVSASFYLVLLGIVLGIVQGPIWLCLSAPWLFLMRGFVEHDVRTVRRWPKVVPKLGFLFVLMLIQMAALWWSSIRNRTPVL